ncbi:MAG: FAD-dependent oxidoreductase [Acidimicrobiales bacterium]|nr:FAD-dependent oxidoreductase [Acidimicrobiales bacterium]
MQQLPGAVDVAVVGAGLAGLAAAAVTTAAGLHTVVLEAGDDVGGRVRTDVVDGFRLDRGFQILLTAYPEVQGQLDLDALSLGRFDPGAQVWTGSGFAHLADPLRRPAALLDTVRAPIGTLADKLRIARLRLDVTTTPAAVLLRRADATTADALVARGFSPAVIEQFFRPLLAGIQLDPGLGTTSRMFEVIFRSLAMGDAAVPAEGMAAIPRQLAGRLPDGVLHCAVPVERLDGTTVQLASGTSVQARAVIVATDGPAASRLLGLPPVGSKAATCLWFSPPEAPVDHRTLLLDGTGDGPAMNVAVLSNVAPSYAPPGRALVAAAVPGRADASLEAAARAQLVGWFGAGVAGWELLRVDTIAHGQPVQAPGGSLKRRVRLGAGRYVCGDHRDTASIQGALFSGRRTGEALVADLRRGGVGR